MSSDLIIIDGQVATDTEGARKFLGNIGEPRFQELVKKNIIRKLGRDWYFYGDLLLALESLRKLRDGGETIIHVLPNAQNRSRKRRGANQGEAVEYRTPLD